MRLEMVACGELTAEGGWEYTPSPLYFGPQLSIGNIMSPTIKKPKVPHIARLTGQGAEPLTILCHQCKKAYAFRVWDTVVGSTTYQFCQGSCLYEFLKERADNKNQEGGGA